MYQTHGSSGMDLQTTTAFTLGPGEWKAVPTGIMLSLTRGYEAQIRPRSGLALRHGVTVLNAPATIDSDFRGEIKAILINHGRETFSANRGDRIAQLVFARVEVWEEYVKPGSRERKEGGFGSTGV